MTDLALRKALESLRLWPGEAGVASEAVGLLVHLAEHQSGQVEAGGVAVEELARLDLSRLIPATRRSLMKALVLLGAASEDANLQATMAKLVRAPSILLVAQSRDRCRLADPGAPLG